MPRIPRPPRGATSLRGRIAPLITSREGSVLTLTLNRPNDGNRINSAMAQAFADLAEDTTLEDSTDVVVLSAAGRSFCLGLDPHDPPPTSIRWVEALAQFRCPVVAVISGDAVAEGLELALACDLRIVVEGVHLTMPQVVEGRLPNHGGTQRLPRIIGRGRSLDLLLSGRSVDAREAVAIGLASRVVARRQISRATRTLVDTLAAHAPLALRYAKEAVWRGLDMTLDQGIRFEEDLYALLQSTADRREGVRSFLEKRAPRFVGK